MPNGQREPEMVPLGELIGKAALVRTCREKYIYLCDPPPSPVLAQGGTVHASAGDQGHRPPAVRRVPSWASALLTSSGTAFAVTLTQERRTSYHSSKVKARDELRKQHWFEYNRA